MARNRNRGPELGTFTFPAAWASAFVNGDVSGLSGDREDYRAFREAEAELAAQGWQIVDIARDRDGEAQEARFTWSGGLYGSPYSGVDVVDYIGHRARPLPREAYRKAETRRAVESALSAALAWAAEPGDHGGNPYGKEFVQLAERALAALHGREAEAWATARPRGRKGG